MRVPVDRPFVGERNRCSFGCYLYLTEKIGKTSGSLTLIAPNLLMHADGYRIMVNSRGQSRLLGYAYDA
jgi:hypothetical protein